MGNERHAEQERRTKELGRRMKVEEALFPVSAPSALLTAASSTQWVLGKATGQERRLSGGSTWETRSLIAPDKR